MVTHKSVGRGALKTAVIGAILATASLAVAQDAKNISGVFCTFDDNSTTFTKVNQFTNTNINPKNVVCPVVKDSIGGQLTSLNLLTSNFVSTSCRVVRRPFAGTTVSFFAPSGTTNNGNGTQFINWGAVSADSATLTVFCPVPSGHSIMNVQYSEPNGSP